MKRQILIIEMVTRRTRRFLHQRQAIESFHFQGDLTILADDRPSVFPFDRSQKRLTPQRMTGMEPLGPDAEAHHPPVTVLVLNQVCMTRGLNGQIGAAVCQDGVARTAFPGTQRAWAASDRDAMTILGSAFGNHQVVMPVDLVDMRCFGILATATRPGSNRLCHGLAGFDIDLSLGNAFHARATEIDASIIVPEEVRVYPALIDPDRVRPFPGRMITPDVEVSAIANVGCDHVEAPFVVTDSGRVDATGYIGTG